MKNTDRDDTSARYVICPGWVGSASDGDRHYIGWQELVRLYGVHPDKCVVYEPAPWWPQSLYRFRFPPHLIRLGPRRDGDYTLPDR